MLRAENAVFVREPLGFGGRVAGVARRVFGRHHDATAPQAEQKPLGFPWHLGHGVLLGFCIRRGMRFATPARFFRFPLPSVHPRGASSVPSLRVVQDAVARARALRQLRRRRASPGGAVSFLTGQPRLGPPLAAEAHAGRRPPSSLRPDGSLDRAASLRAHPRADASAPPLEEPLRGTLAVRSPAQVRCGPHAVPPPFVLTMRWSTGRPDFGRVTTR